MDSKQEQEQKLLSMNGKVLLFRRRAQSLPTCAFFALYRKNQKERLDQKQKQKPDQKREQTEELYINFVNSILDSKKPGKVEKKQVLRKFVYQNIFIILFLNLVDLFCFDNTFFEKFLENSIFEFNNKIKSYCDIRLLRKLAMRAFRSIIEKRVYIKQFFESSYEWKSQKRKFMQRFDYIDKYYSEEGRAKISEICRFIEMKKCASKELKEIQHFPIKMYYRLLSILYKMPYCKKTNAFSKYSWSKKLAEIIDRLEKKIIEIVGKRIKGKFPNINEVECNECRRQRKLEDFSMKQLYTYGEESMNIFRRCRDCAAGIDLDPRHK